MRPMTMPSHPARAFAEVTAQIAGWSIDCGANAMMPRDYATHLVAPTAQAVLVPFGGGRDVAIAMRARHELRSDVLVVAVAPDQVVRFGIALVKGDGQLVWGYRLWSEERAGPYWLASEFDDDPSFRLSARPLTPQAAPPWRHESDRAAGFAFAGLEVARRLARL